MKTKLLSLITAILSFQCALSSVEMLPPATIAEKQIITATKKIHIKNFHGAHNPSIVKFNDGFLMSFRWSPNRLYEPWVSYICLVLLNDSFDPISTVDFLDTRSFNNTTPSQAEDGRIFYFNDKLYVIYNDNMELTFPSTWERRDMYMAEIIYNESNQFAVGEPIRLIHEAKYREKPWQKNWNPFVWNDLLLLSYNINPHEVLTANLETGICKPLSEAKSKNIDWKHGSLRGATPAQLVDGEYLAFFHSGIITRSPCSENNELWHYYMGAYTYSAAPPFAITKISPEPLDSLEFYTYSGYQKRVIYPGGYVIEGPNLYLAYGKDDAEIWIATIDLAELQNSLVDVK